MTFKIRDARILQEKKVRYKKYVKKIIPQNIIMTGFLL